MMRIVSNNYEKPIFVEKGVKGVCKKEKRGKTPIR